MRGPPSAVLAAGRLVMQSRQVGVNGQTDACTAPPTRPGAAARAASMAVVAYAARQFYGKDDSERDDTDTDNDNTDDYYTILLLS